MLPQNLYDCRTECWNHVGGSVPWAAAHAYRRTCSTVLRADSENGLQWFWIHVTYAQPRDAHTYPFPCSIYVQISDLITMGFDKVEKAEQCLPDTLAVAES